MSSDIPILSLKEIYENRYYCCDCDCHGRIWNRNCQNQREEAVSITDQIFHMPGGKKLSDMETHTIHYGHIRDGEEVIDEVMVLLMRGPLELH